MDRFTVSIDARPVAYLKRVSYGAPMVVFAKSGEQAFPYTERAAKSWQKTLNKYFGSVSIAKLSA